MTDAKNKTINSINRDVLAVRNAVVDGTESSKIAEKESTLWERMRDTLLCLKKDNKISVKDLSCRLAYSTQEFLYLTDLFFDLPLEELRKKAEETEVEKSFIGQVLPYERNVDTDMIDCKFVRRPAQIVEAVAMAVDGDVFQIGMDYIERQVKGKWQQRERAGEYLQFWWHDDAYHFSYMTGAEIPKDTPDTKETIRVELQASDYIVFTLKEQYYDKQTPNTIKMLIKYALCDWIKTNEIHYDNRKIYFLSFENGKYSVYLPLEKRMHSDYVVKNKKEERKIYGIDEWISYIDEHITENLTAKSLAKTFHYSEKHLKNIFQLYYEVRIADYIKQRKLYFVAQELKEGKNPEKMSVKYNFKSYSAFSTAFRKEYGVVPAKYYRMEFQNAAWVRYIDEHITENITPEIMAEHFNYSRDYFRKAFQDDFGMGLSAYISQRKIQQAARELRQGEKLEKIGAKYGFKSRNGFDKAFRKAFCTSPSKYAKASTEVVDLNQFYSEYKDKMKISFMDVDNIKMVGWTIIPNRGREVDIPAQVAFWLDEDSPYFKKMNSVAGSTNGNDKIAMWYHDPECVNIEYILGPVVNSFANVPEDAVQIEISAGRFAVFETDRENDVDNLADTIRMFSRCVFYGWIKEHRDMISLQNFTFERYINKKVYIYVPISV